MLLTDVRFISVLVFISSMSSVHQVKGKIHHDDNFKRSIFKAQQWPSREKNGLIEIPYVIEAFHETIIEAINTINAGIDCEGSGIKVGWVPRNAMDPNHDHFVKFVNQDDSSCYSRLGRSDKVGGQKINIARPCNIKGSILYEIMHTMGFTHENNRPDRDEYITIQYENIEKDCEKEFKKDAAQEIADYTKFPYDYDSITHFSKDEFGKGLLTGDFTYYQLQTIKPKDPDATIGQRTHLSVIDIKKINYYFSCAKVQPTSTSTTTTTLTTKPEENSLIAYCDMGLHNACSYADYFFIPQFRVRQWIIHRQGECVNSEVCNLKWKRKNRRCLRKKGKYIYHFEKARELCRLSCGTCEGYGSPKSSGMKKLRAIIPIGKFCAGTEITASSCVRVVYYKPDESTTAFVVTRYKGQKRKHRKIFRQYFHNNSQLSEQTFEFDIQCDQQDVRFQLWVKKNSGTFDLDTIRIFKGKCN